MASKSTASTDAGPLFCDRCVVELQPGTGNFYRVSIEAVADATPAIFEEETDGDLRKRIEQLLDQMAGMSEQEALDQVYRRVILYLCGPCYREWIENPTG